MNMKKYIKRMVVGFRTVKIESSMQTVQLLKESKKSKGQVPYEIYTMPTYLPMLTLNLVTQDGEWKNRQIKITNRSFIRFKLCIRKAIEWFYDTEKKRMFLYDDNGDLTFNHEFKELSEVYYDPFESKTFLKIIPATIQNKNGKMIEGVNLYINQLETMVGMSRYDLEDMMSVLSEFNFQEEAIMLMNALMYANMQPDGVIENQFYIEQSRMDGNLRAVPIDNSAIEFPISGPRKNPFGV